jgi:hypothetical protein
MVTRVALKVAVGVGVEAAVEVEVEAAVEAGVDAAVGKGVDAVSGTGAGGGICHLSFAAATAVAAERWATVAAVAAALPMADEVVTAAAVAETAMAAAAAALKVVGVKVDAAVGVEVDAAVGVEADAAAVALVAAAVAAAAAAIAAVTTAPGRATAAGVGISSGDGVISWRLRFLLISARHANGFLTARTCLLDREPGKHTCEFLGLLECVCRCCVSCWPFSRRDTSIGSDISGSSCRAAALGPFLEQQLRQMV